MSAPRTYLVGLPVAVTVHDDGKVEYWIDTAETGVAIFETEADDLPDEAQMLADQALIDADHDARFAAAVAAADGTGEPE